MNLNEILLALITGGGLVKMVDVANDNRPRMRALKRENQKLQSENDDWHDWRHKLREWFRVKSVDITDLPSAPSDKE